MHMLVSFASAACGGEAGAGFEGVIEPDAAGRISAVEEALLGATPLGTGVFLRERGHGGRGHGAAIPWKSVVDDPGENFKITAPTEP
jgi:hypothetical protein